MSNTTNTPDAKNPYGFPEQKCEEWHDNGKPCYGCWLEGAAVKQAEIVALIEERIAECDDEAIAVKAMLDDLLAAIQEGNA